jgi:phage protein D
LRSDCTGYTFDDFAPLRTLGAYVRRFDPATKQLVEVERKVAERKAKDPIKKGTVPTLDGQGHQDRAIVREAMGRYAAKPPETMERAATLDLPGNPKLIAGATVELPVDEWGKNGGVWAVKESSHTLDAASGYRTSLSLKKK